MTMLSLQAPPNAMLAKRWKLLSAHPANTAITLLLVALLVWFGLPILRWALLDAVWWGTADDCAAETAGACWAFLGSGPIDLN